MKKIQLSVFCLMLISFFGYGQEYKKFKVGLGLGYASPAGDGAKGGVLVYMEPGYRVSDQLLVNLRLESALVARASTDGSSAEVKGLGSYTLNGHYYFGSSSFRPYVGMGFGLYNIAGVEFSIDANGGSQSAGAESKFGFYPRVGFDFGHFNMSLDYNLVPKSTYDYTIRSTDLGTGATVTTNVKSDVPNSYLALRFGFSIGGGKSN